MGLLSISHQLSAQRNRIQSNSTELKHSPSANMHFSTIFAILSAVAPVVIADCCGAGFCHSTTPNCNLPNACADGTWSTPCCGYGGCNIFCCACDGGKFWK